MRQAPAARGGGRPLRLVLATVLALAAAAVSGCAGQQGVEAIYRLTPVDAAPGGGSSRAQLLVPVPAALASLDTERIAVKPTPISMSYYERVAWEDTAPRVFQVLLLESLQNTDRVRAVGLPGQSLLIDYQIVTEIRNFHAETFAGDRARVTVSVKILNDRNGRVVAERVFDATVPMGSDAVDDAVRGIEAAAQALIGEMIPFILANT